MPAELTRKFRERERSSALVEQRNPKRLTLWQDVVKNWELYVLCAPFFLLFIFMMIIPILSAIGLSFTYYNMFEPPRFIGLSNYINLFVQDEIFGIALRNTLLFSIITGPTGYILCFMLAWLINEFPRSVRVGFTLCFYAPALAGTSVYFIWQFLFSGDVYGLINSVLMRVGLLKEPIQWLTDTDYNFGVLILAQLWMSLGTGFLAFIAGFQGIDESFYEAGSIDGIRNRLQEIFYITLPMMKPQLLFGAVMQISASFSVSTLSSQLFGTSTNYSTHTIVLHMIDYGTVRYEMGYACALAVVLFMMMILFKTAVNLVLRYVSSD